MEKNQVNKLITKVAYKKALALSNQVKDFGFMTKDTLEDIVNIVTNNVNKYFDPQKLKNTPINLLMNF